MQELVVTTGRSGPRSQVLDVDQVLATRRGLKVSIISAADGDFDAAKRSRGMAVDLIAKYGT